jgi:hypothetical protein
MSRRTARPDLRPRQTESGGRISDCVVLMPDWLDLNRGQRSDGHLATPIQAVPPGRVRPGRPDRTIDRLYDGPATDRRLDAALTAVHDT